MGGKQGRRAYGWLVITGFAVLLALSSSFIVLAGPEASDFEETTGIAWADLSAQQPVVANYIAHLLGLLGVAAAGLAALGGGVAATAFRHGERWSWFVVGILPLTYLGFVVVFFRYGFTALAVYYSVPAAVMLLVLALSARRYLKAEQ